MLFATITEAEAAWEPARWRSFGLNDIACQRGSCPHCGGEVVVDEVTLDCLQRLYDEMGNSIVINTAHRCAAYNAEAGGSAQSEHLSLAFDVAVGDLDRKTLFSAAWGAGFSHVGFKPNALHLDARARGRELQLWSEGPDAAETWGDVVKDQIFGSGED